MPSTAFPQTTLCRPVIPFGGTRNEITTDLLSGASQRLAFLKAQFGHRLRQIRGEMRKTQEEFAEMTGMSVDFLSLIERGRNAPSFTKLERMIEGLGVSAAYLFTFEQGSSPKRRRKSRSKQ